MSTASDTRRRWWHNLGGLPFAVFVLVACNTVAIICLVIRAFAAGAMSAVTNVIVVWAIIASLVLLLAIVYWIRGLARRSGYDSAKTVSNIGLLMIVILSFAGIIDGGEWAAPAGGVDAAFRTAVLATLTLVLIHTTAQAWVRNRHGEGPPTGSLPKVAQPK